MCNKGAGQRDAALGADCGCLVLPQVQGEVSMCFQSALYPHGKIKIAFFVLTSERVPVSEPAVALSTFLLLQLPFSSLKEEGDGSEWPCCMADIESSTPISFPLTATMALTLPIEGGHYLSLQATLLRTHTNTISIHLQPATLLVNSSLLTIQVTEGGQREEGVGKRVTGLEGGEVGTVLGSEVSWSSN